MIRAVLTGAALGAGLLYLLDPDTGRRRRAEAMQRGGALARQVGRGSGRRLRRATSNAQGLGARTRGVTRDARPVANDQMLTDRVRSIVFRAADTPPGSVNINVADGVVELRGEVTRPEQINDLVEAARAIAGVREVNNLLHLAGTPAPMDSV